jgi:hypothetical protein
MALTFNGTTDFMLIASTLGFSDAPLSMSFHFVNANTTALMTPMCFSDGGGGSDHHGIDYMGATANDPMRVISNDSGIALGFSSDDTSPLTGFIVIGSWNSTSSRVIRYMEMSTGIFQGYSFSPNTTLVTPDALSEWNIGRFNAAVGRYVNGTLSHVAIWNVGLSADDALSLGKGFSPRRVRPQNLVFYAPIVRDIFDWKGGATISVTGTTAGADTRAYGF